MLYYLLYFTLTVFWIFDILDMPFMDIFDTTYPINTLAWLLIWIFFPFPKRLEDKNDN